MAPGVKEKGLGHRITSKLRLCISLFLLYALEQRSVQGRLKWCISDQSMESIAKAYIHHFETVTRCNYLRPALAREYMHLILVRNEHGSQSPKQSP
jgi:translation initiation factor 2 beta subunit (eIF-2beta)/eIF-5